MSGSYITYDKKCMKRGMVDYQVGETEVPTILMGGIKPGINVIAVFGFPVIAYTSGKTEVMVSIWGVAR